MKSLDLIGEILNNNISTLKTTNMKTYNKTTVSKLVDRFDNELRTILMNDLKAIRSAKEQLMTKLSTGLNQDSLSAA